MGVALGMDAVAVSLTDGMREPRMRLSKMLAVAGAFALFQFIMPLVGYYCGYALSPLVEQFAPWLSFFLLALIGGKTVFDNARSLLKKHDRPLSLLLARSAKSALGVGRVLMQALATSLDALAVGVTLLAADASKGLPFHAAWCALVLGAVTFPLSLPALIAGTRAGNAFSERAGICGGAVLVGIGLKILLEGVL